MEQDYNVWFGNRLNEIIEQKGLTAKSLGELSGVGRMTISRILHGRYATAEEVKKIADALEITVDRLKQKDVDVSAEKRSRARKVEDPKKELQEALHNISIAIGKTETGLVYQVLGSLYYNMHDFGKSVEAYRESLKFLMDHEDSSLVYEAYNSVMVVLVYVRDYASLNAIFQEAESTFQTNQRYLDRFLHLKASILVEHTKQYDEALTIYQHLVDKQRGVDDLRYRRNLCNLGDVSFRMGKFELSKMYYDRWFEECSKNETNLYVGLYNFKDYAKTLISVGETKRALKIIEDRLETVFSLKDDKLISHYLFLYELVRGDGSSAEKILTLAIEDEKMKVLASAMLAFAHNQRGEGEEVLRVTRTMLSTHLVLE